MELFGFLFNILFSLIKLAILGSVYASLFLIVFIIYNSINPSVFFNHFLKNKIKAWFKIGALFSVVIFFYSFSHYGDNGFGIAQRLPLDYRKEIFIGNDGAFNYEPFFIDSFVQKEEFVYGKEGVYPDSGENYKPDYFIWNLETNEVNTFTEQEYLELFAKGKALSKNKFKSLDDHYSSYWFSWMFFITI